MSDLLTINTDAALHNKPVVVEEEANPLTLFGESFPLLGEVMPEYSAPLPNPTMNKFVKELKMTMKLYGGLGLSANQVGAKTRVFVIGTDQFQMVCINPKVLNVSADLAKDGEGCLSYPGLYLKIERPSWIEVEFTNEFGETKQTRLEGVTARCFLHELDHLNGVRFVQHVKPLALQMARQKQTKIIKKIKRHTR